MFKLIKIKKYDNLIANILYISFFFHQLFFVLSGCAFVRSFEILYKFTTMSMIITFLSIILCNGYYFFRGKFSFKEIVIYALISIILFLSFVNYRNVMVFANLFAIAAFKNVDVNNGLKCYVYAVAIGIAINIVIGFTSKCFGDVTQVRYGVERIRHGLGFFYPTLGPFYFASLVLAYIVYKDKLRFLDYIVFFVVDTIFFIFTDTKEPFVFVILLLFSYFIINKYKQTFLYNIFGIITILSFPILSFLSCALPILYKKIHLSLLNSIVTGRLSLGNAAIETFGFKLFGQNVNIESSTGIFVDASFLSLLILNGIVVFILCISFMTYYCYISYKTKKIALLIALLFIALRSTFDLGFMALQFSPVVIMFMPVFNEYKNYTKT